MDTGNNTAEKTAPERYVSEKAFEELPDTFQKLAELLGEDQFELVAVNDEKGPQDQKVASESAFSEAIAEKSDDNIYKVDSYVKNGEIRLVYLMNDAVESFLVFGNARMTGVYKPDYEGEILADLSRQGREYILVVHQDDSVVTLFFETLSLEKYLYDYSRIGHFWIEGYEYLRQLEYRLAILRDKYDYIGGDSCNALEEKLSVLVEFPPLNYCCYPSVPEKYIVPRENPWIPSEKAIEVMGEIARQAGDRTFVRWLEIYRKLPFKWVARKLAGMLHRTKHIQVTMCLSEKLREASSGYGDRSFGKEADEEIKVLTEKASAKQAELKEQGIGSEVFREEPFTIARDSLGFKVYLMKWNKGRKDCTVEIEEICRNIYRSAENICEVFLPGRDCFFKNTGV